MNTLRLYTRYFSIHVRSAMQYKSSFFMTALGQFLSSFGVFLAMYFMFERFPQVQGYTFAQCLLCYGSVLVSFSLSESFFRGFDRFPVIIGNGGFDRALVRPRGLIFQVLCSQLDLTRLGRLVQAAAVFIYAIPASGVAWTADKILCLVLMILGGVVLFSCVFLIYAAICFFTLEGLEFMNILTDGIREYGKYPFDVYGKGILIVLTVLVPYTLIQYFPFQYLIGRTDNPLYMLLPLPACLYAVPGYALWRYGVRKYKSTGS